MVVETSIRITLRDYYAPVKIQTNQVHLETGMISSLSNESCYDLDGSEDHCSTISNDSCEFNEYNELYEGPVTKLTPTEPN